MRKNLFLLLGFLFLISSVSAQTVFEDGFEDDSVDSFPNKWQVINTEGSNTEGPGPIEVVDTEFYEGSQSLLMEHSENTGEPNIIALDQSEIGYDTGLSKPISVAIKGSSDLFRANVRIYNDGYSDGTYDESTRVLIFGVNDGNVEYFDGSWNTIESGVGSSWVQFELTDYDTSADTASLDYNVQGGTSGSTTVNFENPSSGYQTEVS